MSTSWSKDVKLDPTTFGGTKACIVLVDMMNNDVISVYEKHRVLSFITGACNHYKWIKTIPDKRARNATINMLNKILMDKVNKMAYPPKFVSFLRNVMCHHYRRALGV